MNWVISFAALILLVASFAVWIVAESVSYRISMNRYHCGD